MFDGIGWTTCQESIAIVKSVQNKSLNKELCCKFIYLFYFSCHVCPCNLKLQDIPDMSSRHNESKIVCDKIPNINLLQNLSHISFKLPL